MHYVTTSGCLSRLFADEDGMVSPPSESSEDTTSSEEASPKPKSGVGEENSADMDNTIGGDEKTQGGENAENVLIIDTTFTCKIFPPGMDPFEIKVGVDYY